mgnify:CR=1 FL=1
MARKRRSKKYLTGNLDLIRDILRLIEAGYYPAKIARVLGTYKQLIYYHLRKLEKAGFVRRETRDRIVIYSLTDAGKKFLAGVEGFGGRWVRLHNVRVLYPVIVDARVPVDWGRVVRLRNWRQFVGTFLNVTVRRNEGKQPSIEVLAEPLVGDDPYQLLYMALRECDRVAEYLEQRFGMKLGRGRLVGRPHWAIYDPIAKRFSDHLIYSDEQAQIDKSPPSPGEIDFFNPEAAKQYLISITSIPARVGNLEKEVKNLPKELENIKRGLDLMAKIVSKHGEMISENNRVLAEYARNLETHLAVMRELRQAVNELRLAIIDLRAAVNRLQAMKK